MIVPMLASADQAATVPYWALWVTAGITAIGLPLVNRLFGRTDQINSSQIELQKVSVNANVEVIKALQAQVTALTERNSMLDARRAEAETDKNRAMIALGEGETKYRALLLLLEDRQRRDDIAHPTHPSTKPEEGA